MALCLATVVPKRVEHFDEPALALGARVCSRASHEQPAQRQPRVLAKFVAGIDYLVPLLDIGYVFFWIPA